jgi:hypothetical protein
MITSVLNVLGMSKELGNMKAWLILASVISVLGTSVVQGLVWIALSFQYYNLVERQTGSGLLSEIDSLGKGDWDRPKTE